MQGIGITHRGMEAIAGAEVQRIVQCTVIPADGFIEFSAADKTEIVKTAYLGQSFRRVLVKLISGTVKDLETLSAEIGAVDITPWCIAPQTFAVECERNGEHPFSSQDLAMEVGKLLEQQGPVVNLKNPEVRFFLFLQDTQYVFGVDTAGDLSKRHWRIFSQSPLKPTVASGMLKFAQYENGQVLLDPFCRDGAIGIAAFCMATGRSPHVYAKAQFPDVHPEWDKQEQPLKGKIICSAPQFGEVKGAEKNAKIAGIKGIEFRRVENEWLDLKFAPGSVDRVVSLFPQPGARHPPKVLERLYRETLKLLAEILKKNGRICTISNPVLEAAAQTAGFQLKDVHEVWQGKLMLRIVVFTKNN